MKFVLVSILCALMVKAVISMPVGVEPAVQSDQLAVVPLEKSAPILATEHILRREVSESDAPTVSEHREGETLEEHAKHAHLPVARLDDKDEKSEPAKEKSGEPKSLVEEVKVAEEKKDEILLKNVDAESALAAKAIAADFITPLETLVPIPAEEVARTPIEKKNEAPTAEEKSAPAKVIDSELKEELNLNDKKSKTVEKTEEPLQPIAKSSPIASEPTASDAAEPIVPALPESDPSKEEKKIEAVIAESEPKSEEEPKKELIKAEDKTDRVTRGTEEATSADAAAQPASVAAAPAPALEVAATVAESEQKLIVEKKEELHEKLIETAEAAKEEKIHELAKSTEQSPLVQLKESATSELAADEPKETDKKKELNELKVEEPIVQAKMASAQLETQPEAQPSEAAAVPTEVKPEPIVDTIKTKSEPIDASNESVEAVKAEDSSSSEEKSSEEDQSAEKLEKLAEAKSVNIKKDESKAEELPKPQEIKELKTQE